MKRILLGILFSTFFLAQGQNVLYHGKYIKDTLIDGSRVLMFDTTHAGDWVALSRLASLGGGSVLSFGINTANGFSGVVANATTTPTLTLSTTLSGILKGDGTGAIVAAGSSDYISPSAPLTGLSTASATPITASDNVLGAFGKLQAQISLLPSGSFINNSGTQQASANFNIDGAGTIGNGLFVNGGNLRIGGSGMGSEKLHVNGGAIIGTEISGFGHPLGTAILTISNTIGNSTIYYGQGTSNYAVTGWVYNATPANAYFRFGTAANSNPIKFDGSQIDIQTVSVGQTNIGGALRVDGATILKEIATPSNPSSGFHKIYPKSSGDVVRLNSAGTETTFLIGGTPSASTTNTVTNKIAVNIGGTTYYLLASTSGL
jgi:hypothetical protein